MSPVVELLSALTVAAAGADPLRSIAMPFAAAAERFAVFTVTATPGDPIAPADDVRATEAPDTGPMPVTLPTDATVTEPLALTGAARAIAPLLLSVILPALLLAPATVRTGATLLSTMSPEVVLLPVNALIVLVPVRVMPPADEAVSAVVEI